MKKLAAAVTLSLSLAQGALAADDKPASPSSSAEDRGEARRLLEAGKEAFRGGRFDEAAKLFGAAYDKDASLDAALFNAAYALRRGERYAAARDAYARYLEKHPTDLDSQYALGRTEQLLGNDDAARRWYTAYVESEKRPQRARYVEHAKQQLAELAPEQAPTPPAVVVEQPAPAAEAAPPYDAAGQFAAAMKLYQQKQYRESAAIFLEVYERDSTRKKALYRHALALRQDGDLEAARAAYERFLAVEPNDPDGVYGLAETERAAGKSERALGLYERYIDVEKRPSEKKWVQRAHEYVALLRASLEAPSAPAVAAAPVVPAAPAAPAVTPPPPPAPVPAPVAAPLAAPLAAPVYRPGDLHRPLLARKSAMDALVDEAERHLEQSRPQAALDGFTFVLAQAPDHARAGEGKKAALAALGEDKGPSAPHDELHTILKEGEDQLAKKDAEAALKAFQRAHALAPSSARPHWGLARAYEQAGLPGAAKHHYRLYRESAAADREEPKADEAWWKLQSL